MVEFAAVASSSRRFVEHNTNATLLGDLAILLGCSVDLGGRFPDGKRPDILRAKLDDGILFLGDAKHTETPGCALTRVRLRGYFRWLAPNCVERLAIVALCFTNPRHRVGWMRRLIELGESFELTVSTKGFASFGRTFNLVWVAFAAGPPKPCSRPSK
jgi:hypothetical protein